MSNILDRVTFNKEIKKTATFKNFLPFKQKISGSKQASDRLHDYYKQAILFGINYLRQNPNLFVSDVNLIEDVIVNNTKVNM